MTLLDFTRRFVDAFHLDPGTVADRALWAAGESQKATAIPALVAVASLSLLVVLTWVAVIRLAWSTAHAALRPTD